MSDAGPAQEVSVHAGAAAEEEEGDASAQRELAELRSQLASQGEELGRLCDLVRVLAPRLTLLDVIGVVVAHNRGQFAHECWQVKDLCRETRYIEGVTQPGSLADMVFHGCRLSGVSKLLEEARKCRRDWRGMTQLIRAARNKNFERVQQLFRLGCPAAVVDAQDADGKTALSWGSDIGFEATLRELLAHGADVNVKDKYGWTPLMWASHRGHLSFVRLLCDVLGIDLTARADVGGRTSPGRTALGWALFRNRTDVATFLRSRDAPE